MPDTAHISETRRRANLWHNQISLGELAWLGRGARACSVRLVRQAWLLQYSYLTEALRLTNLTNSYIYSVYMQGLRLGGALGLGRLDSSSNLREPI